MFCSRKKENFAQQSVVHILSGSSYEEKNQTEQSQTLQNNGKSNPITRPKCAHANTGNCIHLGNRAMR